MNVLFILGTRPEAIKLAPLIRVFRESKRHDVKVCVTAQHREMLDQVLAFFNIIPDYDLNLMKPDQSLFQVTAEALTKLDTVLTDAKPEVVFVQGDTTTVLVGALACYYKKIKVAHVEAGLRTYEKYAPYPEEMNRQIATRLSHFHFAPTILARQNLERENIVDNVFVVGNTVVDALHIGLMIVKNDPGKHRKHFAQIDFIKRVILVTCHRRENFGQPFENICEALMTIASKNKDVEVVYPVHLNPNIRQAAFNALNLPNIHLIEPLDYPSLIWLLSKSYLVLTDSGGIQEEAPALGKPVLVLRNETERQEGIDAGTARLVGTDKETIINATEQLLTDRQAYQQMATCSNPYGDGQASARIFKIVTGDRTDARQLDSSRLKESLEL